MTVPRVYLCPIFSLLSSAALFCLVLANAASTLAESTHASPTAPQTKSVSADEPASPAFDVAAIHRHIPEPHEHNSIWSSYSDSHFRAENVSLIGLIHWAFDTPETRILKAPAWASSTYFNIEASSDPSMDAKLAQLPSREQMLKKEAMVRTLLADRFKLMTHFEIRKLPIYELIVAGSAPKLGEAKREGTTVNHRRNRLEVQGDDSLAVLAEELSKEVGRPVIDRTGISGRYDLNLQWTPDAFLATATPSSDAPPSIFTALEEQLGLKLKSAKGPVRVLVVDHAEMPSAN